MTSRTTPDQLLQALKDDLDALARLTVMSPRPPYKHLVTRVIDDAATYIRTTMGSLPDPCMDALASATVAATNGELQRVIHDIDLALLRAENHDTNVKAKHAPLKLKTDNVLAKLTRKAAADD